MALSIKTVGFYYAKVNKSAKLENLNVATSFFMGMGYYARANPEPCLLATYEENEVDMCLLSTLNKAPTRESAGVRKLIVDYRREHSRKPSCVHDRIDALFW